VMVVYGEHDAAAIPPIPERIARILDVHADARIETIPACGHWAMYEAPDVLNALMIDFHSTA